MNPCDNRDESVEDPPSPCVRNCCLDDQSICLGCYRSISEICAWHDAPDDEKIAILTRCRSRYRAHHQRSSRSQEGD